MGRWDELLEIYTEVEADSFWEHLRRPGINFVPGDGPETVETAAVMVVGEAPGAQENGARRPFVGPSGAVLDDLLEVVGLARKQVFVTNVLKYRPPGNRTPDGREIHRAKETLRREWSVIRPVLTIAVGSPAQSALAQYRMPHGVLFKFGADSWVTSVYHPAFGLRQKKARRWIEEEWDLLDRELIGSGLAERIGVAH